jgi:hypothetical protein
MRAMSSSFRSVDYLNSGGSPLEAISRETRIPFGLVVLKHIVDPRACRGLVAELLLERDC